MEAVERAGIAEGEVILVSYSCRPQDKLSPQWI